MLKIKLEVGALDWVNTKRSHLAFVPYRVSFQICNYFPFPSNFFLHVIVLSLEMKLVRRLKLSASGPANPATICNYFQRAKNMMEAVWVWKEMGENISESISIRDHFHIFLPLIKNQVEIISGLKSVLFIEQLLLNSPISTYSSHRHHSWSDARLMCVK